MSDKTQGITADEVKQITLSAIKAKSSQAKVRMSQVWTLLDKKNKAWVPFKLKKLLVDSIAEAIMGEPQSYKAKEKLQALLLLNEAILKRNKEVNQYVNEVLMPDLVEIA